MYCSTCGARVPDGRSRCDTCGAPVSAPSGYGVPATLAASPLTHLTCPQCGFQGQGVSYFSQGGHIAALVLLMLLTAFPLLGAGGLVYWLLRYDHRVCPRCGDSWGKRGQRAQALALSMAPGGVPALPQGPVGAGAGGEIEVPSSGGMQFGALLLFAFAAFLMMIGLGDGEAMPFVLGLVPAAGGVMMLKGASSAREERRRALLIGLQQPVLRLAGERGGRLTVTEVASSLGWPMPRAEKVLNSLEDGWRVASEVTDEGVIVYEFRELVHVPRVSAGEMDPLLGRGPAGGEGTLRA